MKERLIKEKSVKFSYAGLVSQRNVVQILEVGGKVRSKPRDPSNPIHATFSTLVDDKHIPSIGLSDVQMAFRFIGTASDEHKQTCSAGLEDLPNSKLSPSGSTHEWL